MFAKSVTKLLKTNGICTLFLDYFVNLLPNCKLMQEIKPISTYKQGLKELILNAAMAAFTEKGIRAVKMDDVAASLSISKRTLYEIYANKEDLLFEVVRHLRAKKKAEMLEIRSSGSDVMEMILWSYKTKVDEFRLTSPAFYSDLSKYPRVLQYLERENQGTRGDFLKFLNRGVEEGYFRNDVNFDLASRMFEALGRYIMSEELYKRYSIEDIFKDIVFVSLRGLCTLKGVQALEKFY